MAFITHSALYNEMKDLAGLDDQIASVVANPVIVGLGTVGPCKSDLFRYTRSVKNGYIHRFLADFTTEQLTVAKDLVEFWQFPKGWANTLDEELALREFLRRCESDGVFRFDRLPAILRKKAEVISIQLNENSWGHMEESEIDIQPEFIFTDSIANVAPYCTQQGGPTHKMYGYTGFLKYVEPVLGRTVDVRRIRLSNEYILATGFRDLLELLCSDAVGYKHSVAADAAEAGDKELLQKLIDLGVDWDIQYCILMTADEEMQEWLRSLLQEKGEAELDDEQKAHRGATREAELLELLEECERISEEDYADEEDEE